MKRALEITRRDNFSAWYQEVVRRADLAEISAVRGCMVIKPWGFGIWERMQAELDRRFKETGHENCYFPLFIPLSFFSKEAEHIEGFAKEMAVVTHHRLAMVDGDLKPDPEAALQEPLIVRPTSEMIIADSFRRWIKTYKDLPVLVNQWANVVRWEMRTRLFLRTAEFLWQEGHTAHAGQKDAVGETMKMLEVYREFAESVMAMPVVPGEKTINERFPGADASFSIEAMMQDGKALQAGTSHYLGTHFSEAQNITYRAADQSEHFVHTTSWGVSTRLIGALIMTHGDDDGLQIPPALAPYQVVLVPRLRGDSDDDATLSYCQDLALTLRGRSVLGLAARVLVDIKDRPASDKRWDWVRKGAPLIVEIGPKEVANQQVSFLRRDDLYEGERIQVQSLAKMDFVEAFAEVLTAIQVHLFDLAKGRMTANIAEGATSLADLKSHFGAGGADDPSDEEEDGMVTINSKLNPADVAGWMRVSWSQPTGSELEEVVDRLKELKLTIRNAPLAQPTTYGRCVFTGRAGTQEILIARAY